MACILALEDNPDHLALITSWIKGLGHTPIAADHADDGMRLVAECEPDLVLCDIRLGGSSGYDVLRSLKSRPATRQLPVVAVTAFDAEDQALAAGFDGYLRKPLTPHGLRAEIDRVLPGAERAEFRQPGPLPASENHEHKANLPRTGKRVLVVDDTAANRELMKVIVGYGGHEVICVTTVAEALASARAWRPDLVLCDVNLGKERLGTELLHAARRDPDLRDLRVAFTSATRGSSVERAVRQRGACAFLRLPMEPMVLLREIGKLLA